MSSANRLPAFIPPMLARPGEPFDSPEHLFEVKWDGTRGVAFIEGGGYRIVNRRRARIDDRYPEFAFLEKLKSGTVLDGEVIVLRDGKPSFESLLSREHAGSELRRRVASRTMPATYVVFDQLYSGWEPLLEEPIEVRRKCLQETVDACGESGLVLSEAVQGGGVAFFEAARMEGLEGVVAKRCGSRYLPGQRTGAWTKIKKRSAVHCAIIGFVPDGENDFRSLIIAVHRDGELRTAGKVGSGIDTKTHERLRALLFDRICERPIIPCKIRGRWVEPGLYCTVSFLEETAGGELRAPVFGELLVE